jgi:hypothetical protein
MVVSASGYPKEGDILILGTRSFFNLFADGTIKAAFDGKDPKEAVEKLAPVVHSEGGKGDVGAVFLKFNQIKREIKRADEVIEGRQSEVKEKPRKLVVNKPPALNSLVNVAKSAITQRVKKISDREIFVKRATDELKASKNRRIYVSAGVILLILLLVSMVFGIRKKSEDEEKARYEDRLVAAQHQFDEATSLYSLDPKRARELFQESANVVDVLIDEGVSDPRLDSLVSQLSENKGRVLGQYNQGVEIFVELPLVSDGFIGLDLAGSDDETFVLNEERNRVISTSFATKRSEVVAGPEQVKGASNIASYTDRVFALTNEGISELDEDGRFIKKDWSGEVLIYAYAGNIYLLQKSEGEILRYAGAENEFASGVNWLAPGVEPDLSGVISWTIDGSIWLLDDLGKISRFSLGNPQNFVVAGVNPSFVSPAAIYTNSDLEFLYVLDSENARVVVIDKEGLYKAQYEGEEIRGATDLAVSEKEGRIIFLGGDKLYSIEIKHLEE